MTVIGLWTHAGDLIYGKEGEQIKLMVLTVKTLYHMSGRMAQRIRRLTTNQEIAGSNPATLTRHLLFIFLASILHHLPYAQ